MNCEESQELLSIYHDGELNNELRAGLEVHLEGCAECSSELAELCKLSAVTRKMPDVRPPPDLWQRISASLADETIAERKTANELATVVPSAELPTKNRVRRQFIIVGMGTAIVFLLALGINWSIQSASHSTHDHEALEEYIQQFSSDPVLAQHELAEKYSGNVVSADEAIQLVGYRPLNIQLPPQGYVQSSLYVLDMPCCRCVEAFWTRDDGSCIAIFEHQAGIEDWFEGRASIRVACGGKNCRLVELGRQFAATWSIGPRMITVIGLRDTDELAVLVTTFT